jgi:tetratricopeptide (TPR) repeat protein
MKERILYFIFFSIVLVISLDAQSLRGLVNDGVDYYENQNYPEAETKFKKAIEKDLEKFESRFNLGDAIYKQGRFDEAIEEFKNSLSIAQSPEQQADIFHNIGNSFLKSQKYQESIAAYREALKLNPDDMETKYNLSYALKQMQDQQNNQQNQQNQDNNEQQNQDQENKDNQQQQQDQENKEEQEQDQQQQQPQEPKDEISKEEAQRILDALKNNEAELQKKMREQKTKKSNVEKDW